MTTHIARLTVKQWLSVAIGVALVTGTVGVCALHLQGQSEATLPKGDSIDLLDGNWQYMDGVSLHDHALTVSPIDAKIVHQDGSGGQPNPAVNLYGTHLSTHGAFSVSTHLQTSGGGTATVRLYDSPPIIADEFRIEPASIALSVHGRALTVALYDGSRQGSVTDPQPVLTQNIALTDASPSITVSRIGDSLRVRADGGSTDLGDVGKLFHSGAIWFGLSSTDEPFSVDSLIAEGVDGGTVGAVDTAAQPAIARTNTGLQSLATHGRSGFKVGAAAALGPFVSDPAYANQLAQNFDSITLENAMKPQFLSPKQGIYTFGEADALIALAHKNGMSVHGHTLAFSEALPAWMRNLPTDSEANQQATATILLDYVTHVMTHFKGKLDSIDVINEPLDTDQGTDLQSNVWYKSMGADYTVRVSQAVHAADPNVKQYINENGAEMAGDRQDALLTLAQDINSKGGFIYGIGLQAHVYDMSTDAIDGAALGQTIDRFGAAGFKVRISENDVTDDDGTDAQAQQYATIFRTCLRNPNCVSYTTWGVNDRYDWFINDDGSLGQGHDLLFNDETATSIFTELQKTMQ